jgi:hypothetical protein
MCETHSIRSTRLPFDGWSRTLTRMSDRALGRSSDPSPVHLLASTHFTVTLLTALFERANVVVPTVSGENLAVKRHLPFVEGRNA